MRSVGLRMIVAILQNPERLPRSIVSAPALIFTIASVPATTYMIWVGWRRATKGVHVGCSIEDEDSVVNDWMVIELYCTARNAASFKSTANCMQEFTCGEARKLKEIPCMARTPMTLRICLCNHGQLDRCGVRTPRHSKSAGDHVGESSC